MWFRNFNVNDITYCYELLSDEFKCDFARPIQIQFWWEMSNVLSLIKVICILPSAITFWTDL